MNILGGNGNTFILKMIQEDKKTCERSPECWLVLAHRKEILQVALDVPYTMDVVLPLPPLEKAVAVDVDHLTG